jgi:hypothetical protein
MQRRRVPFTAEVLALFQRLDAMPQEDRSFTEGAKELASALNLDTEFWTGNTPLDRSGSPCHPPGYAAFTDWHTCRRVRNQLLAAIRQAVLAPADASDIYGRRQTSGSLT